MAPTAAQRIKNADAQTVLAGTFLSQL